MTPRTSPHTQSPHTTIDYLAALTNCRLSSGYLRIPCPELQGPVAAVALANHLAGPGVQSGEEGRGAVAHVIMSGPLHLARAQGQKRPGAVQGLDLGLLVHAQDQRPVRRVR